ncbi:MAG: hypothetical protein M3072_15275 [Candidatus Dormibacteraeota bacterium]|nr:hypothetical protein [Candidatus Dormibacteraeota bacterium]
MKARVVLYEDPGGPLIIRREGTRTAFLILNSPPWSFSAEYLQRRWPTRDGRVVLESSVSARAEGPHGMADLDSVRAATSPSAAAAQLQIWVEGT